MAKGKGAAKRATRTTAAPAALDVDYEGYPKTAKGRAMARQAARRARDEKLENSKAAEDAPAFVVADGDVE